MSPQAGEGGVEADDNPQEPVEAIGDAAIETTGLTRVFGTLKAVDGVDLTVRRGELFSLLGLNGAGKTTLIKMLCCLLRPTSGTANVMGHDVGDDPLAVKRIIAVSPRETAIAERLTARENLRLMAGLASTVSIGPGPGIDPTNCSG